MNRRDFSKLMALGSMGMLFPYCKKEDIMLPSYTKALVIGTGFGGAVTALRLGQAGIQTTVLERGQRWTPNPQIGSSNTFAGNLPADKRGYWMRDNSINPLGFTDSIERYAGVLEVKEFNNMNVYAGAAVGGGSVVYGGITIQPPQNYFEEVFPQGISYSEMDASYFPRVLSMLNATPIPQSLFNTDYYTFAQVLKAHAENAGYSTFLMNSAYKWDVIESEINGLVKESALIGETIHGNNSGCKNSLDQNYIPMAEATGNVLVQELHQVKNISKDADGRYVVEVEVLKANGSIVDVKSISCDYLFMGAGSMGTTKLLLKAREKGTLANLSSELGENWGPNGNIMWGRSSINENTGVRQAAPAVLGVSDYANPYLPINVESAYYPSGLECHCNLQLSVSHDLNNKGTITYNSSNDDIDILYNSSSNEQGKMAHEHVVNTINNANSGVPGIPGILDNPITNLTYHPLGGAEIGVVTDLIGRVKNYDKFYVMDGSLIPGTCASVNPSLTIAALAERNIEKIIAEDFS